MPSIGGPEIIIVALIILLLFGFKKLPDAARSIGKSARVFKSEVNEMKEEDRQRAEAKDQGTGATTTSDDTTVTGETTSRTDNQSGSSA